jgi:hypothetical protein
VPYLLLGLQDVQWAMGNSRGARKLARTPHVNQKKKKKFKIYIKNIILIYFKTKNILINNCSNNTIKKKKHAQHS